jgi:hypothetical protein
MVRSHWFWNSALHYTMLPVEMAAAIAEADIVLLKGDANYRRLLVAPRNLRNELISMIHQEMNAPAGTGKITLKINSLSEKLAGSIKRSEFGMTSLPDGLGDEVRLTASLETIRQ